ncbi:MAG: hypothetical protein AAFR16_14775, partial [Pseudomonadota bacterium]
MEKNGVHPQGARAADGEGEGERRRERGDVERGLREGGPAAGAVERGEGSGKIGTVDAAISFLRVQDLNEG